MEKNKAKFRNPCLVCGKEEKDAFLGSCFSCWRELSSKDRRALRGLARGSPPKARPAYAFSHSAQG